MIYPDRHNEGTFHTIRPVFVRPMTSEQPTGSTTDLEHNLPGELEVYV